MLLKLFPIHLLSGILLWGMLLQAPVKALEVDLAKAVLLAKEHNTSLQNARSQTQAAQVQASLARNTLGPTLTAGSDISRTDRLDERSGNARWGADLSLSQSLDFSKFQTAKSMSLKARALQIESEASEHDLIGNVVFAYLQFARDSLLVEVARADLKNQQEKWHQIQAQLLVGLKSQSEILQQEALMSQSETQVIQAERTALDSKASFVALLGTSLSPDTITVHLQIPSAVDTTALFADTSAPSLAVQSQESRIQAAQAALRSSQLRSLPTFSVGASLNHTDPLWSDPATSQESSQYLQIQARVQLRILDGGERSASIQQEQISLAEAQRSHKSLQQEQTLELQRAVRLFHTNQAKRRSADKALQATQKSLQSMRAQYELGAISLLDLRQAELQEISTQSTFLQSQFECLAAFASVRIAQNRAAQILTDFARESRP